MPDREKVIIEFERCIGFFSPADTSDDYFKRVCQRVLELLKEQEPIQMKVSEDYGSIKFGDCPKCKSFINNRSYPKSCGCGQKVKWDETD